ncbi:Borrelia ORF-A-containing protein (plasmid) [Borrelia crocidurae str. Achema]|uniref:Borrelia ORF-A-containing protein n=2 Tax=Borrelia crocidurae TaxID=29520 RepID=I0FFD5_BORCA|nr:Borrelia ORF-A-containing protein [Borrelia crocidurae str. Achema]
MQQKIKNGNVELKECNSNIYNNKEERKEKLENKISIEKKQIKKYAEKCNIQSNLLSSILDLNICKNNAIEIFKAIKKDENQMTKNECQIKIKQKSLDKILKEMKKQLENKGYDSKTLKTEIYKIYEKYKNKPHFIIENEKYKDLDKIKNKLERSIKCNKIHSSKTSKEIKINIFSILFDRLQYKLKVDFFVPILKDYLNKQEKLEYNKAFNDQYYNEILKIIENKKDNSKLLNWSKINT